MLNRSLFQTKAVLFAARPALLTSTRAFSAMPVRFNKQQQTSPDVLEETESYTPAEVISGAPPELAINRIVRIYQAAKPATQSGSWGKFLLLK